MIRRTLLLIAALVAITVVVYALVHVPPDPETRIRRLLAAAAESFDAGSVGGVLDAFADDYHDTTLGLDRDAVRGAMLWLNLRRQGGRFAVELDADAVPVAVSADAQDRARAEFELALLRVRGEGREPVWRVAVQAEFARRDGSWLVTKSTHKTVSGARPR